MAVSFGRVSESGRISLPAEFRQALGLTKGGDVAIELDGCDIRIRTLSEVVSRSQALSRQILGDGPDTGVDAFLAARRRDSE